MPLSPVSLNQVDYSNEGTRSSWNVAEITGATYVAVVALAEAVRTAIQAISLCNEKDFTATLVLHSSDGVPPSNVYAQRELAIRVFYRDTVTGRAGSITIPGPDLTVVTLTGDEVLIEDGDVMEDFKTAFELSAKSLDENAVVLTRAVLVGRNS